LDGVRLHVVVRGATQPTVVIITGGGEPACIVAPLQERIARFATVFAYDRPGLGWSDAVRAPLSFEDQARWLKRALAAAGQAGPYVLVAASLGGLIARAYARAFPDDVAAMVLVDAAEEEHIFQRLDVLNSAARKQLFVVRLLAATGLLGAVVRRSLPAGAPAEVRAQMHANLSRWSHWQAAAREVAGYALTPLEQRAAGGFGALNIPLTVIAHGRPFRGSNAALERGWREAQERLAALAPQARLVIAESASHSIAQEDPDLVAAEVQRLVAQFQPNRGQVK
jgi:pimeloyl-ACP methyl ester carboxylesterase